MDFRYFAFFNSLGHFNLGYSLIYLSSCLTQALGIFEIEEKDQSYVSGQIISIVPFGAMIGSLMSGIIAKSFTQRDIFIYMDMANILATVLVYVNNLNVFILARFFQGIYIGLSSVFTTRFLLDSVKSKDANMVMNLVSMQVQIAFTIGVGLSILMPIKYDINNTLYMFIYAVPIVTSSARLLINTLIYRYETPLENIQLGQDELAYQALLTIYGNKKDAQEAFEEKKESHQKEQITKTSRSKYLYIGLMMVIVQQLSGVNAINFYVSQIFEKIVNDVFTSRVLSFFFVMLGPSATAQTPLLISKFGNKNTIVVMSKILVVILIIMSISSQADQIEMRPIFRQITSVITIVSVSAYNFIYNSQASCCWVFSLNYLQNICGLTLSNSQMSLVSFTSWLGTAVISFVFPILMSQIGISGCFTMFCIFSVIGIILVEKFVEDDVIIDKTS